MPDPMQDAAWRLEDDDNVNYLCAIDDIRIQTADTVIQELGGDFQDSRGTKGGQLSRLARKFAGHPKEERKAALKYRSISVDNGEDFYYPLAMSGRSRSIESLHSPSSEEMKRRNIPPATPPSVPPPTSSRVNKKLSNKHRGFSIDSAMGPNLDKGKRSRKTSYGPMPSPVLFDSVELQDLDAVRSLLNSPHCPDINSINEEGFTPLDVAVMTNNVPMSKMLITAGAVDNPRFSCPEARGLHLATLVSEAERKVDNIMQQVVNMGPPTSAQQQKFSLVSLFITLMQIYLWMKDIGIGEDFYYPLAMSGRSRSIESLHSPSSEEMKRRNIPPATPPSVPPPTSSRVNKKLSNKHRGFSIDSAMGPNLDKGKRSRKTSYGPMPSPVLFDSVELQDLDAVRSLLNSPHCPDINSINEEGFTPLDVAVMTNNVPMSKMLITAGAVDNPRFSCPEARGLHLATLVSEAERKVDNIMQQVVNMGPPTSAQQQKEQEQQLKSWEWRFRLLKRMKAGFEHARPPGAPTAVRLGVSSSMSLVVSFQEPDTINGAMATRYKVEWSCYENFVPLAGEFVLSDLKTLSYNIMGLSKGNTYYVRVSACNVKGWGPTKATIPPAGVPSNWRELEVAESQDRHRLKKLEDLKTQIKNAKMLEADTISTHSSPKGSPPHMRRSMKKGLKNFFQSVKFHRNLKSRGVYLATILYHGDHILVTGEDNIPVVEVDDTFPSMLNLDLHWFMKVSCTWSDLRQLRQDLDRCASASSASFRSRLLQAAIQLQNSLGVQDLGYVYHTVIKDSHGSIVIPTVRQVKDPKYVQSSSLKWVPISRLQRRRMSAAEDPSALERLLNRIPEIMHYNHNSTKPPPKGLYIGYLKLCSSMDSIGVLVPKGNPNMLPHCRIRDNPNVSSEEWDWVRRLGSGEVTEEDPKPSQAQSIFRDQLIRASKRLLNSLDISEEDALQHRLFCTEVLELDHNVSMLLLVPPVEEVCCAPGQTHHLFQQDSFLTLPLQVFELVHMTTFQRNFFDQYATLSSQLEVENFLVQHQCREAFSDSELSGAKHRQLRIANFQQDLEDIWRGARWIMDVLQYARDRTADGGLLVERIYQSATPSVPKVPTQLSLPKTRRSSDSDDNFARRSPEVCSSTSDEEGVSKGTSPIPTHVPFSPPLEPALVLVRDASPSRPRVRSRSISPVNRQKDVSSPQGTTEGGYGPTKTEILTGSTKAGILRVYPDYHTGLAKGTSVKLHVTTKTTSREVIDLVVRQINKAGRSRDPGSPMYPDDLLHNFFLVAIIAGRERQLPDTYQPLQLQNPWAKGKLLVRLRDQATAALAMLHETQSTSV
ncbi:PREDICTED: ankyrin repeat and fibronectin type-III domain-containing protein 1-like [Branchiostoma belcheri]|uniref:Ankyrin repeat and fibronectin type-III domain-containing protein 1-like n=1 Tax=Branchiostoma belcheri TaxID=7741 RepID=A0A6P5AF32_BRABE|nr:PREDICTED: ankyrin repeat and fibronectin type-III domain-containing protein 1-like [Branchiostoma belcheri]